MTKRAVGIGGVFFKGRDPERLRAWYRDHLGLEVADWGGVVFDGPGTTVWNIFSEDTRYFDPSPAPFMINYRVENLDRVLAALRSEGCEVDEKVEASEYGRFGWVMDPEGNRVELWEPPPK
jgi:catechol 2,3-dioxygenase-like lactoylglutathione lyase family enzyme